MKKKILVFLLLLNLSKTFSQNNLLVDYEILFNRATFDDVPNQSPEFVKMKNMILSAEDHLFFKLMSDGKSFVFYRESINLNSEDRLLEAVISSINPDQYFGNIVSNKIFVLRTFNNQDYKIPFEKLNWQFHQETKEIEGFLCYKATALDRNKNEITAWFSSKIPQNIGPNEAIGLPGLVLELNYTKYNLVAKKISFEINPKHLEKKMNPKSVEISQEEFIKIVNKTREF